MHSLVLFLFGALAVVNARTSPARLSSLEERTTSLKSIQSNIYVGVAVSESYLSSDSTYSGIVSGQFNCLTPGNEMKWDATENTQGVFTYTKADQIVSFAQTNNMKIRGHTLVWYSQTPSWVQSLSASEMTSAMQNHISKVMGHYKGKVYAWDVLNEVFSDNGDGSYRSSFWYKTLGTNFTSIALTAARAADPNAKLYINDYSVEGENAKSNALYALAKTLKTDGLLDGVGFQSHFEVGGVPSDMKANLQRFADLGLDVAITELDIRMKTPGSSSDLAQQAKDYKSVVEICRAVSRCVGVTVWGVGYSDSWIPSTFSGWGDALLWDSSYQPTAAYTSFASGLAA